MKLNGLLVSEEVMLLLIGFIFSAVLIFVLVQWMLLAKRALEMGSIRVGPIDYSEGDAEERYSVEDRIKHTYLK